MISPLTYLAKTYTIVEAIGMHSIGSSPALIALFLYALLPVVSNMAIGFDSVSSFGYAFRRATGETPGEYRCRIRGNK